MKEGQRSVPPFPSNPVYLGEAEPCRSVLLDFMGVLTFSGTTRLVLMSPNISWSVISCHGGREAEVTSQAVTTGILHRALPGPAAPCGSCLFPFFLDFHCAGHLMFPPSSVPCPFINDLSARKVMAGERASGGGEGSYAHFPSSLMEKHYLIRAGQAGLRPRDLVRFTVAFQTHSASALA